MPRTKLANTPVDVLAGLIGPEMARAVLAKLSDVGLVIVPREATPQMIDDGWASANAENAAATWLDMVQSVLAASAGESSEAPEQEEVMSAAAIAQETKT